jgi:hypothetical protein
MKPCPKILNPNEKNFLTYSKNISLKELQSGTSKGPSGSKLDLNA